MILQPIKRRATPALIASLVNRTLIVLTLDQREYEDIAAELGQLPGGEALASRMRVRNSLLGGDINALQQDMRRYDITAD